VSGSSVSQVAEVGVFQDLIIEPAIDDALPEAPLLAQLRAWNSFLLSPLVDGLRSKPEIGGDLLERENVVSR